MQMTVVTSVVIVLISVFMYWYFPLRHEQQTMASFIDRANTIATMMAYSIAPAIEFDDHPGVCEVVISAKKKPDLDYVVVIDTGYNVLATHDSIKAMHLDYQRAGSIPVISDDSNTLQVAVPIMYRTKYVGTVYLGLSLAQLNAELASSRKTLALVSLIICIVGIGCVAVMSAMVTKPLRKIVKTVEHISKGDFSKRVNVRASGEVEHLANTINWMVENLEVAYEDLRRSEKSYRDLFEANPQPMWVHDIESRRILEANDAAVELYGYSREEFLKMTIHDFIVDAPFDKLDALFSRTEHLYRSTGWRHLRKDASVIEMELSSQPLPLRSGRRSRLVLANDITQRAKAEAMLRESEERYRDLFESASDLIMSVGPDLRFQFVNKAWLDVLGYGSSEIETLTLFDIVKPEELPHFKVVVRDVLYGKSFSQVQTVFIAKNGTEVVVEGSFNCKLENGEAVSTRGIFRDVTGRKQAEAAIHLQKTRFEQLFEKAPIGIVMADKSERIIHANSVFQSMFGYNLTELNGRTINDIVVPLHAADEGAEISKRVLSGDSIQTQGVRRRKDGSFINVDLYGVPILVNGKSLGLFGIYVDTTERIQAEEKQRLLMKELENINRELNDFAYIVSHDLKAPLRAIGSLVDWLVTDYGDKLGAEGNEMLQVLLGRTKRMHQLIDGVLRYSRIGRTKEDEVPIDLAKMVPEVIDMIDPPKHIAVNIETGLPTIMGEETRIQQVFQNLLGNAVKFNDKPQGEIRVCSVRENGHWKFCISDNGPGIDEKHHKKIFQIFQTLSPRDEFESTGIGLTIVKKIIELHGGQIWVESSVGQGTRFFFTLPSN